MVTRAISVGTRARKIVGRGATLVGTLSAALALGVLAPVDGGTWIGPRPALAQGGGVAAIAIKQSVKLPEDMLTRLQGKSPDARDRRQLAAIALHQYLRELLLEAANDPAQPGAAEIQNRVREWIKLSVRNRFEKYAPNWSLRMAGDTHAEVTLTLSRQQILADFDAAGLGVRRAAVAGVVSSANNNVLPGSTSFPFAALLVDERNRHVYVLPADAAPLSAPPAPGTAAPSESFQFYPGKPAERAASDAALNALDTPLDVRAGHFASAAASRLSSLKISYDATWARQAVQFLEASGRLSSLRSDHRVWPPAVSFAQSTLAGQQGILAVFTVRSPDKAGILEKIDLLRFTGSRLTRSYWSRNIQDPALREKASKAIEKAAGTFVRQVKVPRIENADGVIRIIADKKLGEKELLAVEGVLKTYVVGTDAILVPYEVNRKEVRYATPVVNARIDRVLDRIKKDVNGVHARAVPGEGGYIMLTPK